MKPSSYNIFFHYPPDDVYMGMNLVSGGMYVFTPEQYETVRAILSAPDNEWGENTPLKETLTKARFLLDDSLDEFSLLKLRNRKLRYNPHGLALAAAPTLACNFDCPYCYVDREKIVMSDSVMEAGKSITEDYDGSRCTKPQTLHPWNSFNHCH